MKAYFIKKFNLRGVTMKKPPEGEHSIKLKSIQIMLNKFGIEVKEMRKKSHLKFTLKTSHKNALLLAGTYCDVLNFDFLTFKKGKIETNYPANDIIQKIIDYGNQYVDFFEALRIVDIETNQLHSYVDSVKAYIDFEFDLKNPDKNEIVLNFEHNKSKMSNVISNQAVICSGTHTSMYMVFDLEGNMKVNRINVARKRTLEAWDNVIEKDFKEYGLLTEMVKI
jgi:hypothetical protein